MHRALLLLLLPGLLTAQEDRYFEIHVVDAATERGVPLVELETTSGARWYTDSSGRVAFFEPGLMGAPVFFHVRSHGYEHEEDGFGFRGLRLVPLAGDQARVELRRVNVAERLYRITGSGIHRDSVMLGRKPARERPLLNARVMGQDSVQCAPYRGRLFWIWGDTSRPGHPLGNFAAAGATCPLDVDPGGGIDLDYFVDEKGFTRPMAPLPGPGAKWLDGLMTVPDPQDRERLVAHYVRVKKLGERYGHGLVIHDDTQQGFVRLTRLDPGETRHPCGHPVCASAGGKRWYYLGTPFFRLRVPAELAAVQDPEAYEEVRSVVALRDAVTGRSLKAHHGSIAFNGHRGRWVAVFTEEGGTSSYLGEVWYAEADTARGPWVYARKIVTHDRYSFYNPMHHPWFDADGGRVIHFEGTYSKAFSATRKRTPRYDYNQIMYRLDLGDPRMVLPVPVYRLVDGSLRTKDALEDWSRVEEVAFYAPDRPRAGLTGREGFFVGGEAGPHRVETEAGLVWRNPLPGALLRPEAEPVR